MTLATRQATGAAFLALLLCGQLAACAAANPNVIIDSAMHRGRIADHIDLLKALDALSSGTQPSSARKSPTAAGAAVTTASVPASLAAKLSYWKTSIPPLIGGEGLSWQTLRDPSAATAMHLDARKLASYYAKPATVALLKANPTVVPPLLAKPEGVTRSAACKEALKVQLSGKAKYDLCNEKHPYVSAESASILELDGFMDAQSAVAGKQVADWHAGIRPRTKPLRTTGRLPPNAYRPVNRGSRRSMQATCSGFESFLNVLLGDGRDYMCIDVNCEFQIPDLPLFVTVGGNGCLGVLRAGVDTVFFCMQNGCNPMDITDKRVLTNLIPSISTQTKVSLYAGLCLGIEGLEKILKKIGMSVCIGPTFTLYPLASQFQSTFGVSLLFAGVEIGGRIQLAPGTGNPLCSTVRSKSPTLYNQVLKCIDFCAWTTGNGAFEFGAWLNLLFFRKTWSIAIVQTKVPDCDK